MYVGIGGLDERKVNGLGFKWLEKACCSKDMKPQTPNMETYEKCERHLNRGQLKIALQKQNGVLELKVFEVRHLAVSQQRSKGQLLVRASIGDSVIGQSELISMRSSTPIQAAFYSPLKPEDEKKRLSISLSVQHQTPRSSAEFIGCMSFGMRHLMVKLEHQRQAFGGWYYILSQRLGDRKHLLAEPLDDQKGLRCASQITGGSLSSVYTEATPGSDDSAASSLLKIFLPKLPTGYGFTVQGSCPVKVCHVKRSGAAAMYKLMPGDEVLRINGDDVSQASASQVAHLVKNSQQLNLELRRPSEEQQMVITETRAHQNALVPLQTKRSNTYESLTQAVSPKVGCIMLNHKKPKSKKQKKSLNCILGCKTEKTTMLKAFQNENLPPPLPNNNNNNLMERFLKQSVEMAKTPSVRTKSVMSAHLTDSQIDISQADTSLLFQSKQYTPKPKPFMERYSIAKGNSPSAFLRSQMSSGTSPDIHRWLDGVASDTMLRKDGSYSNSGTSPEVSPEQTFMTGSEVPSPVMDAHDTLRHRLISEDNLKWDPGISLIYDEESYEAEEDDSAFAEFDNAYISGPLDEQADLLHTTYAEQPTFNDPSHYSDAHSLPVPASDDSSVSDREDSNGFEMTSIGAGIEGLDQLVDCELDFVQQMQRGIERFSRPLRHALLPSEQYKALFQNIEKLVALSQYHLQQLNSLPELQLEEHSVSFVAAVYKPRLRVLCEGYDHYLSGFKEACTLLHNLRRQDDRFSNFVQLHEDEELDGMTIDQFIMMPVKHLEELVMTLKSLLPGILEENLTSELYSFGCVVEDLDFIQRKWSPVDQGVSPVNVTAEVEVPPQPEGVCQNSQVDAQVQRLQSRLNTRSANNVHLTDPHRHVLFSSDMLVVNDSESTPATAWLLSDMLLITKPGVKDELLLAANPLELRDIVSCELGGEHSCELLLYHRSTPQTSSSGNGGLSYLRLRAPHPEIRHAWSSLLDHRLSSLN
ncbi:hypothetical protein CAPTEDRAFT_223274 [Capitella teleta]|uniref:PDZ domain-containing protein n=1 Tax=Capitella teleta TaxID=283909 RepID=R7UU01_CAPTE|nr:hypothetical protein CAPTEDRAFT_223274 [Capitella teleta]|eukprot:ELU07412.1 hypothetical protein CAPTEDRAFT_223274 [Capitella teleta]